MFYVVQLDSNIFKEKIVVPSIWLDKYDTHCLLPPITDVADVETLAKAQSTPKHGWQMHSVSSIQSFHTYSQAKASITKSNPVMVDLEEEEEKQLHKEGKGKRKRKLPRFLEEYSIESYGNNEVGCSSTQNSSKEDNSVLVPLIVKIERMEGYDAPESQQQPPLNTTHNESSRSVDLSAHHDSQLQVAGNSSSTISSLKEDVKMFVQYALPNLNDSKLTTVTDTIIAEEPSELQDLIYFKEDDFLPILTKIQTRKLMDFIKKNFSTGGKKAEIVEICRKSVEVKKVSTRPTLVIEKSVSAAESEAEPSNVQQSSCFGENWANGFEIPYEKFPPRVLRHCKEGTRPSPQERKHIIRILHYEISKLCHRPRKKNLEIIVYKLIKQYPKSFQDVIGDQQFGNGYATFLNSLISRFDNENRTKGSSLIAKLLETQKRAKKRCINFQPDDLPDEETENSQAEKQKWLQMHFYGPYQNEGEVDKAMSMTFASQRLTINTIDKIEEAMKEWPYLTQSKYLLAHFNTAMQPYQTDWDSIFQKKIPELLRFLRSKITAVATSNSSSIAILQLLCLYFKEVNTIVQIYEEDDSLEIINKDTCPLTPFIAVFGTNSAVVFIERKGFSHYVTPDDAFKMWFASYFVFNLVYPEECQATMEFIQKGLVGIPQDSSCNKQAESKCLKLVKDLSNFKDMWTIAD